MTNVVCVGWEKDAEAELQHLFTNKTTNQMSFRTALKIFDFM
jgi:hypothetical protein